jgi:hypothetical protein
MLNEYGIDSELFDRVCENALNSVSPDDLTEQEVDAHRKWVWDNWDDLNAGN